jgi:UDP-2,3-diacylglucosamine hydrolase
MRPSLFISDLHLHETRPKTSAAFFRFLSSEARSAASLYILGDLFDYWVGDDQLDHDVLSRHVNAALRELSDAGVKLFFMRGNRDFLIGERFAAEAGLTLLDDPTVASFGDKEVILMHGDTLCTDDTAYQQFRRQSRDPVWQANILSRSYVERLALAATIRERSNTEKATKAEDIMDVSRSSVEAVFRQYGYADLIHGHTHRPATHTHEVDGILCHRRVLADWHNSAQSFSLVAGKSN